MMRNYSKRKEHSVLIIIISIVLVVAALAIEMANVGRKQPWSGISLSMATVGLVSGITGYIFNRLDG